MKPLPIAAAAFAVASPAMADIDPLVSPVELAEMLDTESPLVIDIRPPTAPEDEAPRTGYASGHIPLAVNAPYGRFRGPEDNPGQVPDDDALTELLRELGVTGDRPIVVAHQGRDATDFGAAARVYWTLKSSGLGELAILNGGVDAWTAAGFELSTEQPRPEPSTITVSLSDEWRATAEDVQAVIGGARDGLLLDARPESFWAGDASHPAAARPGTLPQSEYFEHANWFGSGPAIVDAEAARRLADDRGLGEADRIVSFCNTGHWAATNWFALSELAGFDDVTLYPASMVGWSNAGHEMANVPGRLRTLWSQVRNVF